MKKIIIITVLAVFIMGGCAQCREEWRSEWSKSVAEERGGK